MTLSEAKLAKINEMIQYIEERLGELKKEAQELEEYQKLDKERRSIEYTLYNKELQTAIEKLEDVCDELNIVVIHCRLREDVKSSLPIRTNFILNN
jgi:chromosome segregation ATPase